MALSANKRVTDDDLQKLKALQHLKGLNLHGSNVTASGVGELKTALPAYTISR